MKALTTLTLMATLALTGCNQEFARDFSRGMAIQAEAQRYQQIQNYTPPPPPPQPRFQPVTITDMGGTGAISHYSVNSQMVSCMRTGHIVSCR